MTLIHFLNHLYHNDVTGSLLRELLKKNETQFYVEIPRSMPALASLDRESDISNHDSTSPQVDIAQN